MSSTELHRCWRRRLVALEVKVTQLFGECRSTGRAETIHDLRVTIRRARLYAQLGRPLLRKGSAKQLDAWGRAVNKLLGPVRDCDVCMNWLAGWPGTTDAIQWLYQERLRLWRQAFVVLNRRKSTVCSELVFRSRDKELAQKLGTRYRKEVVKLSNAVSDAVPCVGEITPSKLHDLRCRLRRWRYLRELSLSKRKHRHDPGLLWLIKVQDALGESQNLRMARGLLLRCPKWPHRERFENRARAEQAQWILRARRELFRRPDEVS